MESSNTLFPTAFNDDEHIDELLTMMSQIQTTSVLHKLEYHRKTLDQAAFSFLILSLAEKLKNPYCLISIAHPNIPASNRRRGVQANNLRMLPSQDQIDLCCRTVLYYIVSVINKYQIPSAANLWNEILPNSLTKNKEFYEYLHKNKIVIPIETCKQFSSVLHESSLFRSHSVRMKLIELGFIFDGIINDKTSIKDLEEIFFLLKQQEKSYGKLIKPENLISFMNTPEKLSLFLSHFVDYDINQINSVNKLNVLEQLIRLKPYFYPSQSSTSVVQFQQNIVRTSGFSYSMLSGFPRSELAAHPNGIVEYRTVRLITLLQQLIDRGARFSKPIYSSDVSLMIALSERAFLATSIGIYTLMGLCINDLCRSTSRLQADENFVSFVLYNIDNFTPEFRDFVLHNLTLSFSLIHKLEFQMQRRTDETEEQQQINDKLFQRSIGLKAWCRLKIRDHCSQNDIKQLKLLSKSLIHYCSFNYSDPNYVSQCISEVVKHRGNVNPRRSLSSSGGNRLSTDEQVSISAASNDNEINNSEILSEDMNDWSDVYW